MKKIAFFDTKPYDRTAFEEHNREYDFSISWFEPRLTPDTAGMAAGHDAVCVFVNDNLNAETLAKLKEQGINLVALRCAGFNNVDLEAAAKLNMTVVRVPAYSPHAVAEYTLALLLCLNRKIHRSFNRVRENNFSINGLLGFDIYGKTVGIVGSGRIGQVLAQILQGFGVELLAYDLYPDHEAAKLLNMKYVSLDELYAKSHIISLHCPLTPENIHMINPDSISRMKDGVILINTSRGKLVDTRALINALKCGKVGGAALDVYEEEADYFFEDRSAEMMSDDTLARLLTFPNVIVSSHQAFFTREALGNIAGTTLRNISGFFDGKPSANAVSGRYCFGN